jgi:hypothetical protein
MRHLRLAAEGGAVNMRRAGRIGTGCAALVLAAAQLGQNASAQDTGDEWQSQTAEQSRIVFVAPGLEDQRARYLRSAAENHRYTLEIAFWRGDAARHDKALVQFIELSPGRHFRTKLDPKHFIEGLPAFEGKDVEFRGLKRNGNRLGTIESRRFGFDDAECLSFAQYWGQSWGDGASAGTNLLYGYYCADPGRPLSKELRQAVIKGLGIKGRAVP